MKKACAGLRSRASMLLAALLFGGATTAGAPDLETESVVIPEAPAISLELPEGLVPVAPPLPETPLSLEEASAIRADAGRILSRDAFRRVGEEAPGFDTAEELSYYLHRLTGWVQGLGATAQWAIVLVCLLSLAAIAVHLASVLRKVISAGLERPLPEIDLVEDQPEPGLERERARAAAADGDFAAAMRHLHRHLRLELDRRRILPYQESWTNGEYLEALARTSLPLDPLRAFTRCCDRVFYGRGGSEEDYRSSLELLEAVLGAGVPPGRAA